MNKNEEINKVKKVLMDKVKSENDSQYSNLSSDEIMKIVIDSSSKGKYVLWVLREYIKGNIQRFEDMGRVKQALTLFKNNLSKFTEQQKQLNKISFQELETLVSPYQDVLTQNEIKRMNKEKIWSEIETIYEGVEGKIYSPKTEQAAIFLGQGTKWCTAATGSTNMFNYYNQGPLYVFVTPEKDENGREVKYQLHFETNQFMNSEDQSISLVEFSEDSNLLGKLFDNLSVNKKIEYFINNNTFFKLFCRKKEFCEIREELLIEKTKLDSDLYFVKYIPAEFITQKLCEYFVRQNESILEYIPPDFITKELCELVVEKNGLALRFVPDVLKTREICELAVGQNGQSLSCIPWKLRSKELCKIAVGQSGEALCSVPEEFITKELCELAVEQDGFSLRFVPSECKTKALCEMAIKQNINALEFIPHELKNKEFYENFVEQNGLALDHVPVRFKTKELCELAVKQNGLSLKHVIDEFRTKELCELAVKQNTNALGYVPVEFITEKMCVEAVKRNGSSLFDVPDKFATKELYELAVKQDGNALSFISYTLRTKELCELAVEQNTNALQYVPHKFKTEMLVLAVSSALSKNNLTYSFDESVKMIFDLEDNSVKNIFRQIKYEFEQLYMNKVIHEFVDKLNNNQSLSFSK